MIPLVLALVLLTPPSITPHAQAEQRIWKQDWQQRVEDNGVLSRKLLAEYLDFVDRHTLPPTPSPTTATATPNPPSSTPSSPDRSMGSNVEQWRGLVATYFPGEVTRALCIMAAESGGNPNAVNPRSGAAGLFQIMPFWWEEFGGDRFDPETNVRVAAAIRASQGWGAWSPYNRGMCR